MTNKITSSQMADRITYYYVLHRSVLKSLVKSGEMPLAHYHILSMLDERAPMRMGEISKIMAISRPNLTPLVDKLVALNYVERIAYNHDRRVTYIAITDAGREALKNEHSIVVEGISRFTSKLSEEDSEKFIAAMDTLIEMFSRI